MRSILILGGYGNFGARITRALLEERIPVIIAGRDVHKATMLRDRLKSEHHEQIDIAIFDATEHLDEQLTKLKPSVVINTVGPFQKMDYRIPEICILHGCHYLDIADARDFVTGIKTLDLSAKQHQVLVVSGASTVPGLSSAVLDHYLPQFASLNALRYGISPGQKAPRGLATTESILSYLGRPLKPCARGQEIRYGWQDLYRESFPEIGPRWMANCDIPDCDLFPEKYHLQTLHFSAGMENTLLHLGMWLMSWGIRLGLPLNLAQHAKFYLKLSHYFDSFGTADGGMYMHLEGLDHAGQVKHLKWYLIAKNGDGPEIPCVPAILLAKKLARGECDLRGAYPCVSLISLDEYMQALKKFNIYSVTV